MYKSKKYKLKQYKSKFIKLFILLISLVAIYFFFEKICTFIDTQCFLFLNKFFLSNCFGQYFWGFLSHKNESWINLLVMIGINILSVIIIDKSADQNSNLNTNNCRQKSIAIILYGWLSLQIVLLINILIFQKFLHIHRDSPSIVILGALRLSKILNNINIKDYSNNSFPAGHAFVLIYWVLFVKLYATKFIRIISVLICIFLILPRMITGAHWLSDTLFSLLLGWMYFNLSMWLANKYDQIKQRLY